MLRLLESLMMRLRPLLYLWVVLTIAVPRLLFLALQPERSLSGNAPAMLAIADSLLAGNGYRDDSGAPDGHFSPVYVGLIAACRLITPHSLVLIKLAHIAFDVLTALLRASLLQRLFSTEAAVLFTLAYALHPLGLYYANNINEECLLTLTVVLSFVAVYRLLEQPSRGWSILAGVAAGVATMVKGSVLLLPAAIVVAGCFLLQIPVGGNGTFGSFSSLRT